MAKLSVSARAQNVSTESSSPSKVMQGPFLHNSLHIPNFYEKSIFMFFVESVDGRIMFYHDFFKLTSSFLHLQSKDLIKA